jgi:uncharacterized protein YbjT (DUF2867 family)
MRGAILVAGADGFVGRALVRRFWQGGYKVYGAGGRAFTGDRPYVPVWHRADEPDGGDPPSDLEVLVLAFGPRPGVTDAAALARYREGIRRVAGWAAFWRVPRVVAISLLAASERGGTALHRAKAEAEDLLRQSGVAWTIVRPSLLFGADNPLFLRLAAWADHVVAPVPRTDALVQPLFVDDLAEVVLRIAVNPATVRETYDVAGPHPVGLRELLDQMGANAVWWPRRTVAVPERWVGRSWIRWPWTPGEWEYFHHEPLVRDSRWVVEFGILPRSLSMFYAPYRRRADAWP